MPTVRVRYFAMLRDIRSAEGEEDFELPEGWSVAAIYAELFPPGPEGAIPVGFAVNQIYVRGDHQPQDGDEVAFIPPVGGG